MNALQSPSTIEGSAITAGIVAGQAARSTRAPDPIGKAMVEWVGRERKISRETLAKLDVGCGTVFFPDAGRELPAIKFNYPGGWKARSFPEKHFVSNKGFALSLWNLDRVLRAKPSRVFITEGEFDAVALVEAGVPETEVLSVPNGAKVRSTKDGEDEGQRGYSFIDDALKAGLNKVAKIIWVGDADEPGLALRADMAAIFGAARFCFVDWPEGVKDANDMLRMDGSRDLLDRVTNGWLPWPVAGLYRLSELPEPPALTPWRIGFEEWQDERGNDLLTLAPGLLSVVTGFPGSGKTIAWTQIWYQTVKENGLVMCDASFETPAKPHLRRQIRNLYCLDRGLNRWDDRSHAEADAWIDRHYLFLTHPEQQPNLKWILDTAEVAVVRHGAKVLRIDPWNRLEGARERGESETDYVGRCLRTLTAFAQDFRCHVQVVAHPSKVEADRRRFPPDLYDISGSANWFNMPDQGFVVHRPEIFDGVQRKTDAVLMVRKQRFDQLGYPCKLTFHMDLEKSRFVAHNPAEEERQRKEAAAERMRQKDDEARAKKEAAAEKREGKRKAKNLEDTFV